MNLSKLGIMQGRLSEPVDNKIQHFPYKNWKNEFFTAKKLNLSCIQWVYEKENLLLNPLYNDPVSILTLSKKTGITVNSVIVDYFMEKKLFNENKDELNQNFQHLKFLIDQCSKSKISTIEIPFVDNSSMKLLSNYKKLIINLNYILEYSEDRGIKISIESDLPPIEFKKFIKSFLPRKLYINFDMGNSASYNHNVDEEINILGENIINVHIKDRKKNGGCTVPLGQGDTSFFRVFKCLNNINYHGDFILQAARQDLPNNYIKNYYDTIVDYIDFLKTF